MTRTICVAIFIVIMLTLLSACGDKSVPPPVDNKPSENHSFEGFSVNWSNRVKSYLWGTANGATSHTDFQRGGIANMGHIRVKDSTFAEEVTINFNIPNELKEVRLLGVVPNKLGFATPTGTAITNTRQTFNFGVGDYRAASGVILFLATATNDESGYYSITFERVQNLLANTQSDPKLLPSQPSSGRPTGAQQVNSIPTSLHGTYTATHASGSGSVYVQANKITLTNALANIWMDPQDTKGMRIGLWGSVTLNQIYQAGGEIYVLATYSEGSPITLNLNIITMDININSSGLRISNINSIKAIQSSNPNIIYTRAPIDANKENWVKINWVTVKAFTSVASLGSVTGSGTYMQDELLELTATSFADNSSFEGWYDNESGNLLSTDPTLAINATFDMELEARFTQNESEIIESQYVNIITKANHGGTINGGGTVTLGNLVTVLAVPFSGYTFDGLYENGHLVTNNIPYRFTAEYDRTLEARFTENEPVYTAPPLANITVTATCGGTGNGGGSFNQGDWTTVWAETYSGYTFAGFYENGQLISSDTFYGFYTEYDRTIEAQFTEIILPPNIHTASTWAHDGIQSAVTKGFVPVDIQNNYTNIITRVEFSQMAIRWVEYATGKDIDTLLSERGLYRDTYAFSDTTDPDILAAYALGITNGTGGGRFTPNGAFDRQQAATMIMNIARALGVDVSDPTLSSFADLSTAASWAHNGIHFVWSVGVMQGTGNNKFSPLATYTREQSIVTFNNVNPNALSALLGC